MPGALVGEIDSGEGDFGSAINVKKKLKVILPSEEKEGRRMIKTGNNLNFN